MGVIFKCGNNDVMDLSTGQIFDKRLLPIKTWGLQDVLGFLERRVYAQTNNVARAIDQNRRERTVFKLGLSDSYWITSDRSTRFEDVSPYYQDFGTLEFVRGFTEPTVHLMGSFDKEWERRGNITYIRKREPAMVANVEAIASKLAAKLGIGDRYPVLYVGSFTGVGEVYIRNMSTPHRMLLDFGAILPPSSLNEGLNIAEIRALYNGVGLTEGVSSYALRVILFDTIIGNQDRLKNQGNWGFFKCVDTGTVSFAPAYDFNLARDFEIVK